MRVLVENDSPLPILVRVYDTPQHMYTPGKPYIMQPYAILRVDQGRVAYIVEEEAEVTQ